ncbi:MAG: hypothetical protein M3342_21790 [Bacteroidota bacterium]|nr:hypothetical protein [Bacteroidota bacterium]
MSKNKSFFLIIALFQNDPTIIVTLATVNRKWNLIRNFTDYEHSSASSYKARLVRHFAPYDFRYTSESGVSPPGKAM